MNQFFSYHMIDSYGCDYSTSGISPDNIETKIKAFFDRRTSDGPKFDTYVLYFSGDTYDTGDWALTGICAEYWLSILIKIEQQHWILIKFYLAVTEI